jgi:hypothetical protein
MDSTVGSTRYTLERHDSCWRAFGDKSATGGLIHTVYGGLYRTKRAREPIVYGLLHCGGGGGGGSVISNRFANCCCDIRACACRW